MRQTELIIILSEPSTFDSFGPVGSLYMTFLVKRTGDVCKPNRVVRFTLRDKIKQCDVIGRHLLSTITRMHRKHLILAVVYDRFLFHASIASKLASDKPTGGHAARRPISFHQCQHFPLILDEWICGITILKITPSRHIFTSSCLATVGFSIYAHAFCTISYIYPPFLRVLCARLLKLLIAFRDIFVLRLNFPGNKLHRFLTG